MIDYSAGSFFRLLKKAAFSLSGVLELDKVIQ